ncbi:MAG: lysylphosphatidylglycerol synthase transmembrane domain-containing protein, partial [archaeon]
MDGKTIAYMILTSIVVFSVIFFISDARNVLEVWSKIESKYLIAACLFEVASIFTFFLRWRFILIKSKISFSNLKLLLISMSGIAFSNLTPSSRFGGEPTRAYFLKKHSDSSGTKALASVVGERVFDGFVFTFLCGAILVYYLVKDPFNLIILPVLLSFLFSVSLISITIHASNKQKFAERIVFFFLKIFSKILKKNYPKNLLRKDIKTYQEEFKRIIKNKELWVCGLLYSCVLWLLDIFKLWLIFQAVNLNVNFFVIAYALIFASLLAAIPLLPGGLGVFESTMIIIYMANGLTLSISGSVT